MKETPSRSEASMWGGQGTTKQRRKKVTKAAQGSFDVILRLEKENFYSIISYFLRNLSKLGTARLQLRLRAITTMMLRS